MLRCVGGRIDEQTDSGAVDGYVTQQDIAERGTRAVDWVNELVDIHYVVMEPVLPSLPSCASRRKRVALVHR